MKNIKDISIELGVNKSTLYKIITENKKVFRPVSHKIKNVIMIDETGIEYFKNYFAFGEFRPVSQNDAKPGESTTAEMLENKESSIPNQAKPGESVTIKALERHVLSLEKAVETKDEYIKILLEQSGHYQELLLVKEKQIMQLQEPKENEEPDHQEEKSTWFKNLFKF